MKPLVIDIHSEVELTKIVDALLQFPSKIMLFEGDLGLGKTTTIKCICQQLGVNPDEISSPTFGLINEYRSKKEVCYHMDFYRLQEAEEAFELGLMEILDSGKYVFIEWPAILEQFWGQIAHIKVSIEQPNENTRRFTIDEHSL